MADELVGTVTAVYRYPVKSMRGESVEDARVYWHGLAGDRRYAFVRGGNTSRFPWLTGREVPELLRYSPYFPDDGDPGTAPLRVITPDGADLAIEDEALGAELAARHGGPVYLLHSSRGVPDSAGVSILGAATVRQLGRQVGTILEPIRFRPNIVVETAGGAAFEEEGWLGGLLRFGDREDAALIRANRKDPRCMMVNLDPMGGGQNPAVLREIVRERDQCAGLYATVEGLGEVRVGDRVYLRRP